MCLYIIYDVKWIIILKTRTKAIQTSVRFHKIDLFSVNMSSEKVSAKMQSRRRRTQTSPPLRYRSRNACRWNRFSFECRTWAWTSLAGWERHRSGRTTSVGTHSFIKIKTHRRWQPVKRPIFRCLLDVRVWCLVFHVSSSFWHLSLSPEADLKEALKVSYLFGCRLGVSVAHGERVAAFVIRAVVTGPSAS